MNAGPVAQLSDFSTSPIHQLATSEWVKKGQPLCLIGDSGTGKSPCSSRWEPRPRWPGARGDTAPVPAVILNR